MYFVADEVINLQRMDEKSIHLTKKRPEIFSICLNSATQRMVVAVKKVVHVMSDVLTIYATLLDKVPHYDDITELAKNNKKTLVEIENQLNLILGNRPDPSPTGWEHHSFDTQVRPISLLILQSCSDAFATMSRCFRCIDMLFSSFDNLKKLLVPCLLANTALVRRLVETAVTDLETVGLKVDHIRGIAEDMVQWDVNGSASGVNDETDIHSTGVNDERDIHSPSGVNFVNSTNSTNSTNSDLKKISRITGRIDREARLLAVASATLDHSLVQYTNILLGRAILKRDVAPEECLLVVRRDICAQAAEHVVSIPLTTDTSTPFTMTAVPRYLFYGFSAAIVFVAVVFWRIWRIFV